MTITYQQGLLASAIAVLAWLGAYALMIRRGFKDRSFGMPIVTLCLNVVWEGWYGFVSDMPLGQRLPNIIWFGFDLGVLYTCLKFGAEDFKDWPLLHQWFKPVVWSLIPIAILLHWGVITALKDSHGAYSASLNTLGYSFVLIGDSAGFWVMLFVTQYLQPGVRPEFIFGLYPVIVLLNVVYVALYIHVAIRDGINPFTRL
jgi:hypothetical protein